MTGLGGRERTGAETVHVEVEKNLDERMEDGQEREILAVRTSERIIGTGIGIRGK